MISVMMNTTGHSSTPAVRLKEKFSPKNRRFTGSSPTDCSSEKSLEPISSAISALAIKKPASTRKSRVALLLIIDSTIQKKYNKNNLQHQKPKIHEHQPARNQQEKVAAARPPYRIQNIHQRTEQEYGQEIPGDDDGGYHQAVADIILPLQRSRDQEKDIAYQGHPGNKKQKIIHGN